MRYVLLILPATISLASLWWSRGPVWLYWLVVWMGLCAWLLLRALLHDECDEPRGQRLDVMNRRALELFAGLSVWAHWFTCLAAIVFVLVTHHHSFPR